jgi:hypothetical protein
VTAWGSEKKGQEKEEESDVRKEQERKGRVYTVFAPERFLCTLQFPVDF